MIPLIIESDKENLISSYLSEKYLLQNVVGEVRPENGTINLSSIKYLIDRAKFSPGQKTVVFIIYDGQAVTPAGQNALLKTLEESKPEQQFVITTKNHHLLLETIVSRCRVVSLKGAGETPANPDLMKQFVSWLETGGSALSGTETLLNDNPKDFLARITSCLSQANRHLPTRKRLKIIALALICQTDLEKNINPRLALDHFLLASRNAIQ